MQTVLAAWREETEKEEGEMSEGFFRFSWSGGLWLGYGLSDGRVRGIYCPAHRAERDARALDHDPPETIKAADARPERIESAVG
jgi:hypothetical protein